MFPSLQQIISPVSAPRVRKAILEVDERVSITTDTLANHGKKLQQSQEKRGFPTRRQIRLRIEKFENT
jgi:hypothetical protein